MISYPLFPELTLRHHFHSKTRPYLSNYASKRPLICSPSSRGFSFSCIVLILKPTDGGIYSWQPRRWHSSISNLSVIGGPRPYHTKISINCIWLSSCEPTWHRKHTRRGTWKLVREAISHSCRISDGNHRNHDRYDHFSLSATGGLGLST